MPTAAPAAPPQPTAPVPPPPAPAPVAGALLAALAGFALLRIYAGWEGFGFLSGCALAAFLVAARRRIGLREKLLTAGCIALAAAELALGDDPLQTLARAFDRAGFLAAFMLLLGMLRDAASTSPSVAAAGRFLTRQPPRRRYGAISWGAHFLTVLLNFGSVNLLAPLIGAGLRHARDSGADPRVVELKERRQYSACLRGFATAILWAPTTVTQALILSMFPGARPELAIAVGFGFAVIAFCIGMAEDMIRHRPSRIPDDVRAANAAHGAAAAGLPPAAGEIPPLRAFAGVGLSVLALAVVAGAAHEAFGVAMVPALMLGAPLLTAGWIALQHAGAGPAGAARALGGRLRRIRDETAPGSAPEAVTLATAGFIGLMLADLIPTWIITGAAAALPSWALLSALPLIMMIVVQAALSPIVTATFLGSALAAGAPPGIEPALFAAALAGGWSLAVTASPFGVGPMILARATGRRATQISWGWNLTYGLLCWAALSVYLGVLDALL